MMIQFLVGKIVKIEGDNRKFRSIFEENLESFSPEKLKELQDIEVQGRYFRAFSLQKDGEIVQIVRDITAEEGMCRTVCWQNRFHEYWKKAENFRSIGLLREIKTV